MTLHKRGGAVHSNRLVPGTKHDSAGKPPIAVNSKRTINLNRKDEVPTTITAGKHNKAGLSPSAKTKRATMNPIADLPIDFDIKSPAPWTPAMPSKKVTEDVFADASSSNNTSSIISAAPVTTHRKRPSGKSQTQSFASFSAILDPGSTGILIDGEMLDKDDYSAMDSDCENGDEEASASSEVSDDEEEQEMSDFDADGDTDDEGTTSSASCLSSHQSTTAEQTSERDASALTRAIAKNAIGLASQGTSPSKSPIIPSLFDDGDAVLYFPTEGEKVSNLPKEFRNAMTWKVCKFTPRVVRGIQLLATDLLSPTPSQAAQEGFRQSTIMDSQTSRFGAREGIVRFAGDSVSRRKKQPPPEEPDPKIDPKYSTAGSKWSLELLEEYLRLQGVDFSKIMENIKFIIVSTIISTHTSNASGSRLFVPNSSSCYELFGFDILLDNQLKPWLMEVNISPSLKASGEMDLGVKSRLVVDIFNLVGIKMRDIDSCRRMRKRKHWRRPTLSVLERQKHRRQGRKMDLDCLQDLTDDDLRVLKESEDENRRRGNFERVFPCTETDYYLTLFTSIPYYDLLLHQWARLSVEDPARAMALLRRLPPISSSPSVLANSAQNSQIPPAPTPRSAAISGRRDNPPTQSKSRSAGSQRPQSASEGRQGGDVGAIGIPGSHINHPPLAVKRNETEVKLMKSSPPRRQQLHPFHQTGSNGSLTQAVTAALRAPMSIPKPVVAPEITEPVPLPTYSVVPKKIQSRRISSPSELAASMANMSMTDMTVAQMMGLGNGGMMIHDPNINGIEVMPEAADYPQSYMTPEDFFAQNLSHGGSNVNGNQSGYEVSMNAANPTELPTQSKSDPSAHHSSSFKAYPATSAYAAAMAIANATARLRSLRSLTDMYNQATETMLMYQQQHHLQQHHLHQYPSLAPMPPGMPPIMAAMPSIPSPTPSQHQQMYGHPVSELKQLGVAEMAHAQAQMQAQAQAMAQAQAQAQAHHHQQQMQIRRASSFASSGNGSGGNFQGVPPKQQVSSSTPLPGFPPDYSRSVEEYFLSGDESLHLQNDQQQSQMKDGNGGPRSFPSWSSQNQTTQKMRRAARDLKDAKAIAASSRVISNTIAKNIVLITEGAFPPQPGLGTSSKSASWVRSVPQVTGRKVA
ncbi:Tubulin polyglutamylase ttll4 [Blyttiomyces sp. JEL0837]|nr:Tubulin polyglutamylase ttll4 [Blyttiomyces sp. JEL0837]